MTLHTSVVLYLLPMQNDDPDLDSGNAAGGQTSAAAKLAESRIKRFQLMAKMKRAQAAGNVPNDREAARLVAEFHARGGQVTVCPPASDEPATPGGARD